MVYGRNNLVGNEEYAQKSLRVDSGRIPKEIESMNSIIVELRATLEKLEQRLEPILAMNTDQERVLSQEEKVSMNSSLANKLDYLNRDLSGMLELVQRWHSRIDL
jgi:hypothetical protein